MHLGHFSNEDFERTYSSPFLQPRVTTNVLNSICTDLQAKQEITKHIVTALASRENRGVKTDFHAKWAMECVGYAFSLPLEQHDIIQKAIGVYAIWLNQPDIRPECIATEEPFYQREIISHYSLLFQERSSYPIHGQYRHAKLCELVLTTLRTLGQQGDLSPETWNALLKALLLVSKQLLTSTQPKVPDLTNQLCPLLLRTLLEMWVRSNTREIELWGELSECLSKWTHHSWLIEHWSSVVLGLSQRLAYMIYAYGSPKVTFEFTVPNSRSDSSPTGLMRSETSRTETVELDLPLEQAVYFGYQLLSMLLVCTKEQLPADPEIDCELVRKVAQIADYFLGICDDRNESKALDPPTFPKIPNLPAPLSALSKEFEKQHFQYFTRMARLPLPSANGLLDMLGSWLFAHASRSHMYEKGRAQAAGALCRIMCKAAGPVKEDYLARFYSVILRCISGSGLSQAAREIIKNSSTLFTMNHTGIRQLLMESGIPKAIEYFLSDTNTDSFLRKACYSVLCSYVALPYYYLAQCPSDDNSYFHHHYEALAQSICEVLTVTLKNERDSDSIRTMTWLITVFVATTPEADQLPSDQRDIYLRFVLGVAELLEQAAEWQLSMDLIEVLLCLASFLRPKLGPASHSVVKPLILKLCDFVVGKMAKQGYDVMVSALFSCLLGWLVSFPGMFNDMEIRTRCLDVAGKGIRADKDFAVYFQDYLLTRLELQLPPFLFATDQSLIFAISSAKLHAQPISLPGKHYLLGDEALVSFYDSSSSNPDFDEVLIVIRDTIGRYAWKSQIQYRPSSLSNTTAEDLFKLRNTRKDSLVMETDDPQTEAALIAQLDEREQDSFAGFSELVRRQQVLNRSFLSSFHPSSPSSYSSTEFSSSQSKSHRELLTCLSLLSLQTAECLIPVEGPELLNTLRTLDGKSDRDMYHLVAIYLPFPEMTESTVTKTQYSQGFQRLLRDLGVKVPGESGLSMAYEHLAEMVENLGSFLYFADFSFEFITISPAVMPVDRLKGWSYQRLTQHCDVVLLWNERGSDPYSEKQPQLMENSILKKKKNLIIVTPLGNNLVKVKLVLTRYAPGPLQSDMVLPCQYLAPMVIRTTISLQGSQNSNRLACSKRRKEAILRLSHSAAKQTRADRTVASLVHSFKS